MKNTNAEILKTNMTESVNLKEMLANARGVVGDEQLKAHEAESDARSLELELLQAQAAHEAKEEAERKGKETSEKIDEVTG